MRTCWAVPAVSLLAACAAPGPTPAPLAPAETVCTAPRPQVCTMVYAPVCASLVAGGSRTYSSACNACADDAVASHVPGACPE